MIWVVALCVAAILGAAMLIAFVLLILKLTTGESAPQSPVSGDMALCEGCGEILPAAANMGWYAGCYECANCRGKVIGYVNRELDDEWHGLPH